MLLIERGPPDAAEVREALHATFSTRGTHPVPAVLDLTPEEWAADFTTMANESGISTADYLDAFAKLKAFWTDLAPRSRGGSEKGPNGDRPE